MNNFTASDFARALRGKMEGPMEVVHSVAQSIMGVMPVTHNALEEAKKDVLTIVADVHQRVMGIEEAIQIETHTNDETSEQLVQGYLAILAARKLPKEMKQEVLPLLKVEEKLAALSEQAKLSVHPVVSHEVPGDGRPRIRFDNPAAE